MRKLKPPRRNRPYSVSETELKRLRAQACFKRDGGRCLKCGATGGLSPSHIYPQGRYSRMKWELDNVKTLCWACHLTFWHGQPMLSRDWIKTVVSTARLARLKKMSQDNNLPKPDLFEVKKMYLRILDRQS
jgi:5-methylcytosine-specific restriction endonuclease McrA